MAKKILTLNYQKKLGKGEIEATIDLSKFLLIATTSTTNPKLSKELRVKLKYIEPFFDKYFWVLFFPSLGVEIVIFLLIKRSKKRVKNEH